MSKSPKKSRSVSRAPSNGSAIDLESVKDLSEFMREQGLVEINYKRGDLELHLRRAEAQSPGMGYVLSPSMSAPTNPSANSTGSAPAAVKSAPTERAKNIHVVKSPFVGTFYRTPGPNQDSFVEEGKSVEAGDTLCIVEAMKLMNEIESDVKGRVAKVLVRNETPVEFGEALFEIEVI